MSVRTYRRTPGEGTAMCTTAPHFNHSFLFPKNYSDGIGSPYFLMLFADKVPMKMWNQFGLK